MTRCRWAVLAMAVALFGSCLVTAAAACPGWRCGPAGAGPGTVVAAAVLAVLALLVAIVARAGWLTWKGCRALATLQPGRGGEADAARRRLGERARLTGAAQVAFCSGVLRPHLYLSVDIIHALDNAELEAVLIHEGCHAAHRDPLRRILRRALADVLWFAPAVAWWAERQIRREEMAADAEAVERVGRRPVAGALVKLWTSSAGTVGSAAYGDAASARVASLLGDLPERDAVPRHLLLRSLAAAALVIPLAVCVATLIA